MARLKISVNKILSNIKTINSLLSQRSIEWTLVIKVLSGNRSLLQKIIPNPLLSQLHSVADSRLLGLKIVKEINPKIETMYLRPPLPHSVKSIIEYADISLNTSLETIKALNEEAKRKNKTHKIIIMIDLGDLREGIPPESLHDFCKDALIFSNIEITGIGTNFGCISEKEPSLEKLEEIISNKFLIEKKISNNIKLISGGSSINLPAILYGKLPAKINHLRIGEAIFLGTIPPNDKPFPNLTNAFELQGNIIELKPTGAILDFGYIDVGINELKPLDETVKLIAASSDMTTANLNFSTSNEIMKSKYQLGGRIFLQPNYKAVAKLMNSQFIEKTLV